MGDEEKVENVVRFPRDWVGPTEELVPIGPRARARAREAEEDRATELEHGPQLTDDPAAVPTAGDFWGEGAAALHHAIQAPTAESGAVDEATPRGRAAAPRARPRPSRRPLVAAACTCLATALIVTAALLITNGGGRQPASTSAKRGSFVGLAAFRSSLAAGINGIVVQVRHETHVARARAVEQADRRLASEAERHIRRRRHDYAVALRRRRAAAAAAASQADEPVAADATDAPSEVVTAPATSSSETSAPEPTTTEPTASEATAPATTESSASSTPATSSSGSAPAGPTGIGGSTGGCDPQCR